MFDIFLAIVYERIGSHIIQHYLQELFPILYDIQHIFTTRSKFLQCAFKKVKISVRYATHPR